MPLIDTHCHIDLYNQPQLLLQECERLNITVLAMTNLPSHFEMGFPHVRPFNKVRLALGMHPLYAEQHKKEFPSFLRNFGRTSYIGEIGLDFSREGYHTREIQIQTFSKILDLVSSSKKVLSIHSRRAEKEVLDLLIGKGVSSAIFHWYSGPLSLIESIASAGFFSINSAMTKSENGQKIISRIDPQKILTETDGPFNEVNGRPAKPSDVIEVYKYLSNIWGKTMEETQATISSNFSKLISYLK
ncbi:TatD DNase family protein [Mucilaginibacter rubeus]|uniref:TatD family hydrolase n=1 Tax=Mucilaginibacter rubeus TaxID=2027860 RepID=UPI003394FFCD